jgi:hypothetical protein
MASLSLALILQLAAWHVQAGDDRAKQSAAPPLNWLAPFRGHPFSLFMLHNQLVAEDVGLSQQQKAEVAGLMHGYARDAAHDIDQINRFLTSAGSGAKAPAGSAPTDAVARLNESSDRYEALCVRVINARQQRRLEQLKLQSRGILMLFDRKLSQTLAITPAQKTQVERCFAECNRACMQVAGMVTSRKIGPAQGQKEIYARRREARQRAFLLLTPAQRKKLDEILGPKPRFEPSELLLKGVGERQTRAGSGTRPFCVFLCSRLRRQYRDCPGSGFRFT